MTIRMKVQVAAVALLLPLGGCGDLLNVESPGRIADSDLGTKDAIPGMVVGMQYDLSQAVDGMSEFLVLAAVLYGIWARHPLSFLDRRSISEVE